MGTKSIDWRPGPTVCRCCLAEGCYKDISTEYFWMGKREVYSEMLTETFDINIAYSTSGPNSNSRLICEPCISRLRDAAEFKRQVHECEKTFMQYLDPGASSTMLDTQVTVEVMDSEVKLEQVKQEKAHSDEDDDDDFAGPNYPDDDDDDDDLDDQPLTKFATRVPKKESVDILDLLDNAKAAEKRKSTTKSKAPPPKKIKVNLKDIQIKPTASKTKSSSTQGKVLKITPTKPIQVKPVTKVVKKKKETERVPKQWSNEVMARGNALAVLRNCFLYPLRIVGKTIKCYYCLEKFDDPKEFREHFDQEHKTSVWEKHMFIKKTIVKVDLTCLNCKICSEPFQSLIDVAVHLKEEHTVDINLKYDLGLHPFKLDSSKWECVICQEKLPSLTKLARHTTLHYMNSTCELCGRTYMTKEALKYHKKCAHTETNVCRKCWSTFSSYDEKREHLKVSKKCWPFCCIICKERFMSYEKKSKHQEDVHRLTQNMHSCPECSEQFGSRRQFYSHYKQSHTNDAYDCNVCGIKFDTRRQLNLHTVKHTDEKQFKCSVCSKLFSRASSLRQHMWTHSEVKKFKCSVCDKQFAQKISLKKHMKSHHPDVNVEF